MNADKSELVCHPRSSAYICTTIFSLLFFDELSCSESRVPFRITPRLAAKGARFQSCRGRALLSSVEQRVRLRSRGFAPISALLSSNLSFFFDELWCGRSNIPVRRTPPLL